jgi:hypothetical protein
MLAIGPKMLGGSLKRRLTSNSEHMTMLDESDAYVAAVRNFLTRVDEGY